MGARRVEVRSPRPSYVTRRLPAAPRELRYALAVGWALLVLVASVVEPGGGPAGGTTLHLHAGAYAGLAFAVGYALLAADGRTLLAAVAVATLFGVVVESIQGTLSYRTMSALDAVVNCVGAVAGTLLWRGFAPLFGVERPR